MSPKLHQCICCSEDSACADAAPDTPEVAGEVGETVAESLSDVSPSLSPAPSWTGGRGLDKALVASASQVPRNRAQTGAVRGKARHTFVQPSDVGSSVESAYQGLVGGDEAAIESMLAADSPSEFKSPVPAWQASERGNARTKGQHAPR